jgi:hypothetical protein
MERVYTVHQSQQLVYLRPWMSRESNRGWRRCLFKSGGSLYCFPSFRSIHYTHWGNRRFFTFFLNFSGVVADSMRRLIEKIILYFAATAFVRAAIEERASLDAFKEKPTPVVLAGVFAIAISFPLGWPSVAALGILSIKLQTPWIVVIGGPLIYGFSHLVFLFGMYLSGATYSMIFCRWLTRVTMERALAWADFQNN